MLAELNYLSTDRKMIENVNVQFPRQIPKSKSDKMKQHVKLQSHKYIGLDTHSWLVIQYTNFTAAVYQKAVPWTVIKIKSSKPFLDIRNKIALVRYFLHFEATYHSSCDVQKLSKVWNKNCGIVHCIMTDDELVHEWTIKSKKIDIQLRWIAL